MGQLMKQLSIRKMDHDPSNWARLHIERTPHSEINRRNSEQNPFKIDRTMVVINSIHPKNGEQLLAKFAIGGKAQQTFRN
jgi:hypothetical protein